MRTDDAKLVVESLDQAFRFLKIAAVVVLVGIVFSGITYVRPNEVALVLRFGKLVGNNPAEQIHGPGLLFAFPYLIDEVVRVPVKRVLQAQLTAFSGDDISGGNNQDNLWSQSGDSLDPTVIGYCITGDKNIVHVRITVKYVVTDPVQYALRIHNVPSLLLNAVAGATDKSIGAVKVDSVLAEGKRALASAISKSAQKTLDGAASGISIAAIEFKEVKPPDAVASNFEDVTKAYTDKKTKVDQARAYHEKHLPAAEAERWRLIQDAQAFSADRIGRAKGEASSFRNVYSEYRTNPMVVRERLYYEAVEKIMSKAGPRVLTPKGAGPSRILIPTSPTKPPPPAKQ